MNIQFDSIRLLVKDYENCFRFYKSVMGFDCPWGTETSDYAAFAAGNASIALFRSDDMAPVIGNSDLTLPVNFREKILISLRVENVDKAFQELKSRGANFITKPADMSLWTIRSVYLRNPENNLIELYSALDKSKWDSEVLEESIRYEKSKTTEFPIIKTERLLLRQFEENDLQNVFKGLSNPDIIKYYGISFDSLEATKEQMDWFAQLKNSGTGIWWAVCSPDNKTFYGAGGLNNLNKEHKKAEIGFWLLTDFWGQGIMVEAMPIICNYGFSKLGLHRIEGFVDSDNINCKKAMAKLNFQYEGTMRDCEIKNGKFISLDIYAITKNE